jgi:uncharacterized membrane protein HdeD (DUF308 family)
MTRLIAKPNRGRGVVALWGLSTFLLGLWLLSHQQITTVGFVRLMAAYWVIGGILEIGGAVSYRVDGSGARLVLGILSSLAGAVVLSNVQLGTAMIVSVQYYLLAFVAVLCGLAMIADQGSTGWWSWGRLVIGIVQAAFGIALYTHPSLSILPFVNVLGILGIASGFFACVLTLESHLSSESIG